MNDWSSLDDTYILPTYSRLPIAIAEAKGNTLIDTKGKSYLDLFTGLAVNILGHSHPTVLKALHEQADRYLHISNKFLNTPAISLAKRLVENSIPGKIFFTNSGAEASETMVKLIHKWSQDDGKGRSGFIVMKRSFHGRTLGAVRLTRQANVYQDFPQPDIPVYEVDPEDIDGLRRLCEQERPAAILAEPILGAGGVQPVPLDTLREMEQLCRTHGMLLCMDEIQTGIGRTGTLFAYQHAGIEPDLILFAKGVGGGLPLGGVIAGHQLVEMFQPGDHGTTFAPSPLSAALGNAVLDVLLEDGGLEMGRHHAEHLWDRLRELQEKYPHIISSLSGRGMMLGIRTNLSPQATAQLQQTLLARGFLVDIAQQTVIRLLPPLTLTVEESDQFTQQLDTLFAQMPVK
ncbi:acetylornithine aminotransferase [Marininema mesophilum]|uniref:Acetylornithine aminotransferase n=1 Tax=Marininema mesophilum TaxID=1048340 RepID=A0A1H2YKS3_9BACL|nr:acetylornithine transaminase [Marininema mesophilum]SDX05823.1 acetylornithine aminotransferase [Marininema mesophilum]